MSNPITRAHALVRSATAALLLAGLSGCASIYSIAVEPNRNDVYGGVRLDGRIIGSAATNGSVDCGLQDCESPRVWMLASGALCDLPLSLIADTVLLPYTLIVAVQD